MEPDIASTLHRAKKLFCSDLTITKRSFAEDPTLSQSWPDRPLDFERLDRFVPASQAIFILAGLSEERDRIAEQISTDKVRTCLLESLFNLLYRDWVLGGTGRRYRQSISFPVDMRAH